MDDPNLKAAIYYLGKYIDAHNLPEKEWLTFSIHLLKFEKGIIKFHAPSIDEKMVDTGDKNNEGEIVSINEFHYKETNND